jgi:small-conductance mechanosensitive channel
MSPFVRNLGILALLALAIVLLNLETSLVTASLLLQVAFFLAIAFVAYMLWRDFGRREIELWPRRAQWVFYGSIALLVVDLGWFFLVSLSGLNALAFFLVAGACVYAAFRTWREQHRYG